MSWSTYLFKEFENEEEVIYRFAPDQNDDNNLMGKIKLDKINKLICEVEAYRGTKGSNDFNFKQAGYCLAKCYQNGEFPDRASRHI